MKRIFSLVLTLSLVLASFCISPVSYADESYSDKAIEVVAKLGLMESGLTISPDVEITRGTLIESVLNLCGVKAEPAESVFSDLGDDHPNFEAIMTAYSMGFVSGFGDGTVRPDDVATVSQAMKLIYYALGYKEFLAQTSSPAMAVERANVGTLGDTNSAKILTSGKLASLMVEAGDSYPLEAKRITNEGDVNFKYYNATETVLERFYDIVRVEGVVTSAGGMNLLSGQSYNSDWIVIGDTLLRKDRVSADAFFGQRVVAYYRQHKDILDKRLVCLYSYNNTVHEISAEAYDGYSEGKFWYEIGETEYEDIDVSFSSVDMFVNNVKVANPNERYFDINSGKITLIDNNKDRKIDVIIVVEYETYVVNYVNAELNTIFGKYNDKGLLLDEYQEVNMVAENGDVMLIEELSSNDVLSVIKAADKSSISIVYALTELRGVIEETREATNGKFYVTIDGKEYRVTDDCYNHEGTLLTTGREGLFPLNASGEVATFRSFGEVARFGYFIQTKQTPGMVSTVMSKILDQSGEIVVYEYDRNVKIDGKVRNSVDATQILDRILVSYTVKDDKIKTVDTPFKTVKTGTGENVTVTYEGLGEDESHLNSLQIYFDGVESGEKLKYKSTSGILGFKIAIDNSAPLFSIPSDVNASDEDYRVGVASRILDHNEEYNIVAYKMQDRTMIADVAMIYDADVEMPEDIRPIFIESASRVLDENGDPVTRIIGYQDRNKLELTMPDDVRTSKLPTHTLRGGDLVRATFDTEKVITDIQLVYSYADRAMADGNPFKGFASSSNFYVVNANVYKRVDEMMIFTTQELVPGTNYEGVELEGEQIRNLSTYTLLKYDERTKTISTAIPNDIVPFEDTGSVCSEIIIHDRQEDPRIIYIYNNPKD